MELEDLRCDYRIKLFEIDITNSSYRFSIVAKEFMNQWSKQGLLSTVQLALGMWLRK
jgi:hypothetical protein